MPRFSAVRHVPYSVEQVFDIAGNVSDYGEFLPLVKRSVVTDLLIHAGGRRSFIADLHFFYGKLNISETLRSHVVVDPATCTVTATAREGPVRSLVAEWKIRKHGRDGAAIHFTVDYTLKSRGLQILLSGMFNILAGRIMTSFEARAKMLYGVPLSA